MSDHLEAIPVAGRDIARAALASAFGARPLTGLASISGGISALTYRIEVGGRAYVLRLEGARGGLRDPHRSYANMAMAAEAGIAPRLFHADPEAGVTIMDFIPPHPFESYPGGPAELARATGRLIASLQATPPGAPFAPFATLLERLLAYVRGSSLFTATLLDPHLETFERLREAYPWSDRPAVSAHNDPNPRNIIFDGQRLWLIDWETSFRNDPFVDIAIVANEQAVVPEATQALLQGWLGSPPDQQTEAQLLLMRQLTRLYYACLILSSYVATPPEAPDADLTSPSVAEFVDAVSAGRLRVGDPQLAYVLAKMNLAGFLAGAASPEVAGAISVLKG
ncbi:MAG TPA: choline/ethanolamine kinase family protein [Caulobacteraceae bacterium]|jgi:hypothetical protein